MLHPRMITLYYENNNTFTQYNCLKIMDRTDFITLNVKHALIPKNGVKFFTPYSLTVIIYQFRLSLSFFYLFSFSCQEQNH